MTSILEAHQIALRKQRISHIHARGLTRDLLRQVQDREMRFAPLDRMLRTPLRACGSIQERTRVLMRLHAAVRQHSIVHQHQVLAGGTVTSGLRLTAARIPWADKGVEDLLMVQESKIHASLTRLALSNRYVASVSHHAISRVFERLSTSDLPVVMAELTSGLRYLFDIVDATTEPGIGRRVLQILLPTQHGTFLGWRGHSSESFLLRTWVASGGNIRVDRTQAAIKAWAATPAPDKCVTFRQMLARAENRWLVQPHTN